MVSGVGLVGVVSGVGFVGVVSGVGVVGVVSGVVASGEAGVPLSGAAVSGVGAAVPGVGAAVPGVGAAVLGVGAAVPGCDCGVVLGVDVCGDGAGAAVCATTQIAVSSTHEVNRALNFIGVSPPISIWSRLIATLDAFWTWENPAHALGRK